MTPEATTVTQTAEYEAYCCHLTPKQLREATIEYRIREKGGSSLPSRIEDDRLAPFTHYRKIDGVEVELVYTPSPSIYPSLTVEDSDEETPYLDISDPDVVEAYRDYTRLMKRAAKVKRLGGPRVAERLQALREEWLAVEETTGITWDEASSYAAPKGRQGQLRINRDIGEVAYCHRDPSDWQIRASFVPEQVEKSLANAKAHRESQDEDFTQDEAERIRTISLIRDKRRRVKQLWLRLFADLEQDAAHGRIVTTWQVAVNNVVGSDWQLRIARTYKPELRKVKPRYIKPLGTVSAEGFIAKKVAEKGDELLGLDAAINSLRYRIEKKAERRAA